jgi:lipid II:glycine glycyltransferase (peptidoglycan interpeptide bridge formation enzyme)
MKVISNNNLENIYIKMWDEFLRNHIHGNIFQSPFMYEVYKNSKDNIPLIILLINNVNEIEGVLLATIQKVYNYPIISRFATRAVIWGGPIFDTQENLKLLLEEYKKRIDSKSIYSQIRNFWNIDEDKSIFVNAGFNYDDHLNILIDLSKNEKDLWSDVHSKRRNEIRRAYKENLNFMEETSVESMVKCYDILKEVYKTAKIPLSDLDFFMTLIKYSTEKAGVKIFIVKDCERAVGCMLTLVYKDVLYDLYAGSYRSYYKKYPNDLVPWEVFLWGKRNGYKLFDFGGAGKPNIKYGVRDYKKKYGGTMTNYGRFEIVHNRFINKISTIGFFLWQKLNFF